MTDADNGAERQREADEIDRELCEQPGETARAAPSDADTEELLTQLAARPEDDGQYADADEARMARLMEFLHENGVTFPSLEIRIVNGLRGVYATERIVNGEVVLHVPRRVMVTTQVAMASDVGKAIRATGRWVSPYGYIAAFMLETRRNGGFWKPYFDVVPSKFPGMPLFYDQQHLAYLRGTHVWPALEEQRRIMFGDYHVIRSCLPGLTLAEFALARMAVTTRVYRLQVDGYETLGMVPLADMLNHTSPSPTHWTGRATNGFTIMALTDLQAGGEILESYGSRSNGRWLMSHGLCMDVNPENVVEIELPQVRPRHPYFYRVKDLGELRGKRRVFLVKQDCGHDAAKHMFSYLRLACLADMTATSRACAKLAADQGKDARLLPPVSRANELAALAALAAACRRGFGRYHTSLEEDEAMLRRDDLVWTLRFAIMAAASEKRILRHYLGLAERGITILQSSAFQLARMVSEEVRDGRPYAAYFRELQEHLGQFSPLWHVSRLPERKRRATARHGESMRRAAHA